MAPKPGVLPLMLLSWPPHRGERTSGAAGHKLAATIEWRRMGTAAELPCRSLARLASSPTAPRRWVEPAAGALHAPANTGFHHCASVKLAATCRSARTRFWSPRRGFRVARLVYARHRCAGGGAAKIRHPPFRPGCLQETHKWALVSFLRIGTLRRHLTASRAQEARIGAISGELPHSSISCDRAHGSDRPWPGT
jgi:hypothetical protein